MRPPTTRYAYETRDWIAANGPGHPFLFLSYRPPAVFGHLSLLPTTPSLSASTIGAVSA